MAASSSCGGSCSEEPAQAAPRDRAEAMASLSFGRVKAWKLRPWKRMICARI